MPSSKPPGWIYPIILRIYSEQRVTLDISNLSTPGWILAVILHDNTVQVYQPPYYNDVSPPKRGFRVKSVDSGEEERRKIEGKQGFARRCSAAEIFGRYRARARSWILHGRDGPLSNSDRQLEGRSPFLELENERSERAPCKDVQPGRPPSLHNFRTSLRLDDACLLSPLSRTHGAIETPWPGRVPTAIIDAACDPIDPQPPR